MTGLTDTCTGTPASASTRIARRRRAGVGARGSSVRAIVRSSAVTLIDTLASPRSAMRMRQGKLSSTRSDLVVMVTGWRASSSTASTASVIRQSRSIGWKGSVFDPSAIGAGA